MSRETELLGENAGRKAVHGWLEELSKARTPEERGAIAGKAYDSFSSAENFTSFHPAGKTAAFRFGFWNGFLDRADELRR